MTIERRAFLVGLAALFLGPRAGATSASNFHAIYDDVALRDRFFLFLQNVFHLVPEDAFHQLILDATAAHTTDQDIYQAIRKGLPGITPRGATVTHALPALQKQKDEMARQSAAFLGETKIDGYLEMGTTGRYLAPIQQRVHIEGPVFVLNDQSPTYGPVDLIERGRFKKVGKYLPLGTYDPMSVAAVPDGSLDLITNFIGFHHCPPDKLGDFVHALRRVLRPGGRMLVREHDVTDDTMHTFVALAHDVFNAGVEVEWEENARQIRAFRSVSAWTAWLGDMGFRRSEPVLLQKHDPTDNSLLEFVKT